MIGSFVAVDRGEVVQVGAINSCPMVRQLRSAVSLISPPFQFGDKIVLLCTSFGVHCFPMVFLPSLFSSLSQYNMELSKLEIWL